MIERKNAKFALKKANFSPDSGNPTKNLTKLKGKFKNRELLHQFTHGVFEAF